MQKEEANQRALARVTDQWPCHASSRFFEEKNTLTLSIFYIMQIFNILNKKTYRKISVGKLHHLICKELYFIILNRSTFISVSKILVTLLTLNGEIYFYLNFSNLATLAKHCLWFKTANHILVVPSLWIKMVLCVPRHTTRWSVIHVFIHSIYLWSYMYFGV